MTTTHTPQAKNSSVVAVASATGDTLLLASNPERKGAIIFNDSTAILYLLLGTGVASSTNHTLQLAANGGLFKLDRFDYTGMIRGAWVSANGNARVTELTL